MISRGSSCVPQKKPLLLKPYSEIYRQRHLKHFPYRQGINISVTLSVQLHWHWPFKKTHYPSKSTTTLAIWTLCWFRILAKLWAFNFGHPCPSLVKGRWIDGKAQALILLLSACDMSTLFMLQTFLPSRRRDCNTYCALSVSLTPPLTIPQSQWRKTWFFANISFTLI